MTRSSQSLSSSHARVPLDTTAGGQTGGRHPGGVLTADAGKVNQHFLVQKRSSRPGQLQAGSSS